MRCPERSVCLRSHRSNSPQRVSGRQYRDSETRLRRAEILRVERDQSGPFHAGVRESPSPPGRGVWGEGGVSIGLPVAKFLDLRPSPPAPLPGERGESRPITCPSQREMLLDPLGNGRPIQKSALAGSCGQGVPGSRASCPRLRAGCPRSQGTHTAPGAKMARHERPTATFE